MKEFVSDLLYMCSDSNGSSRTFYIIVTAVLAILTICIPAMLVLVIVNAIKGFSIVLPLILMIVAIIIYVAVIVWLKKS